jgi:hypothetical protein
VPALRGVGIGGRSKRREERCHSPSFSCDTEAALIRWRFLH